eukprot:gene7459-537_t
MNRMELLDVIVVVVVCAYIHLYTIVFQYDKQLTYRKKNMPALQVFVVEADHSSHKMLLVPVSPYTTFVKPARVPSIKLQHDIDTETSRFERLLRRTSQAKMVVTFLNKSVIGWRQDWEKWEITLHVTDDEMEDSYRESLSQQIKEKLQYISHIMTSNHHSFRDLKQASVNDSCGVAPYMYEIKTAAQSELTFLKLGKKLVGNVLDQG